MRSVEKSVFQSFNLFPHMTVLQNCSLAPMRVPGMGRAEAETLARKYLERVRILDQADKYRKTDTSSTSFANRMRCSVP